MNEATVTPTLPAVSSVALSGASGANVGSVVRSRWANALPDPGQRQTAFAFESVADEVVFVLAPPLITFLAALVAPPVGFLTGLLLGVAGGLALSRLDETAPPVAEPDDGSTGSSAAGGTP